MLEADLERYYNRCQPAEPLEPGDDRNSAGFNMIELGPRPRLHRFVATDPDAQAFEPLDVTDLDPA